AIANTAANPPRMYLRIDSVMGFSRISCCVPLNVVGIARMLDQPKGHVRPGGRTPTTTSALARRYLEATTLLSASCIAHGLAGWRAARWRRPCQLLHTPPN